MSKDQSLNMELTSEASQLRLVRTCTDSVQLTQWVDAILNGKISDDGELSEILIENKNLPFSEANRLSERWRGVNEFGYVLCSRNDVTPEALDAWCLHWDDLVTDLVARNPKTSIDTLTKMARSDSPMIVVSVIKSGRLPEELVDGFAESESTSTRVAVAITSKNPIILKGLAADQHARVRAQAVLNTNTELEIVNVLAKQEEDLDVLATVAARLTDTQLLDVVVDKLLGNRNQALVAAILNNPHSSAAAKTAAVLQQSTG